MVRRLHFRDAVTYFRLAIVGFSLFILGCQTNSPVKGSENGSFMALWSTYAHCQAESDLELLKQDASLLKAAAGRSLSQDSFVVPLPGQLQRLVTTPSARLAVDVKAMAASCSLRAGQTAMRMGKDDLARSLFESVLQYQQPDYDYYSMQARTKLLELDNPALQVSMRGR